MRTATRKLAGLTGLALTVAWVDVAPAAVTADPSDGTQRQTVAPARVINAASDGTTRQNVAPAVVTAAESDRTTRRTVRVRGRQVPVDVASGTYVMRGDLVGDWLYIPRTPPLHASDTLYVEAGTEVFKGCIDRNGNGTCGRRDVRGELRLAFLFWASFDADGGLIKGQCVHPITGGSGAFTGARGVLNMYDRPVGDDVRTTYRGRIVLNAVPSEGAAAPVSTAGSSTAGVTTSTTPVRRAC